MSKRLEKKIRENKSLHFRDQEIIINQLRDEQKRHKKNTADKRRFWFAMLEMFLPFVLKIVEKLRRDRNQEGLYYLEMTKKEAQHLIVETLYNECAFEEIEKLDESAYLPMIEKLKELQKAVEEDTVEFI